jgi:hypothetical protein
VAGIDRKALIRKYKATPPPAGVYRIRNVVTGRSLVGSSGNLPGILNRYRFQLEHGSHPAKDLQRDWNELGPAAFEFEVLDRLQPRTDSAGDPAEDLRVLLELCLAKLAEVQDPMYGRAG